MNLLMHPQVKKEVNTFIAKPSHALLIIGHSGTGKATISTYIAGRLLDLEGTSLHKYPYLKRLYSENASITIDEIRALQKFTSLKTLGTRGIKRIIIIEDAEKMTIEAQNAFLKLLEEPPTDTVIIMSINNVKSVLPTVQSRTQKIVLKQLEEQEIVDYFKAKGYPDNEIKYAYNLAEGRIGLISSLLETGQEHDLYKAINKAKQILSLTNFEPKVKTNN